MALAPQPLESSFPGIRQALAAIAGRNWAGSISRLTGTGMLVESSRFSRFTLENRQLGRVTLDVRCKFEIVGSNVVIQICMGRAALAMYG
jgi:hypothetical protein